jgi:hypothetical protein
MSRNRTIYNVEALYVGPAPDSGYHFIDYSGNLRNLPQLTSYTVNLVKHIPRVQSVSYNIDLPYTNVLYLGKQGTVKQSHFEPPTINLNFEYLQVGVLGCVVSFFMWVRKVWLVLWIKVSAATVKLLAWAFYKTKFLG